MIREVFTVLKPRRSGRTRLESRSDILCRDDDRPSRPPEPTRAARSRGQSLVEYAITLPAILVLLSGLIEFGYLLNAYLDVSDMAREVARRSADEDPDTDMFYAKARALSLSLLQGYGQIQLTEASDAIVISAFKVEQGPAVTRLPPDTGRQVFGITPFASKFTTADVQAQVSAIVSQIGNAPPDTDVVLVEVFYEYNLRLGLPWIKAFIGDPIALHAYAFAPNNQID